jgi:hypothetical protein
MNSTSSDSRDRNLLQSRSVSEARDVENASRQNYRRANNLPFDLRGKFCAQKKIGAHRERSAPDFISAAKVLIQNRIRTSGRERCA